MEASGILITHHFADSISDTIAHAEPDSSTISSALNANLHSDSVLHIDNIDTYPATRQFTLIATRSDKEYLFHILSFSLSLFLFLFWSFFFSSVFFARRLVSVYMHCSTRQLLALQMINMSLE